MRTALLVLMLSGPSSGQGYLVSTVAGGPPVNVVGPSASIGFVSSVAAGPRGDLYFVSGSSVLRMDAATGILSLVAGTGTPGFSGDNGPAAAAQLNAPNAIAVDPGGNVYIADGARIRKVSGGIIVTVAGTGTAGSSGDNGPAIEAQIAPLSLAVDSAGNLYIACAVSSMDQQIPGGPQFITIGSVRKISHGTITTIAGNGPCCGPASDTDNVPATSVPLIEPGGIAVDSSGNLYVATSYFPGAVRKISSGVITTVAGGAGAAGGSGLGDGGPAIGALLYALSGVAVDGAGNLYLADVTHNRIRKVSQGVIATVAGDGAFGFSGDNGPATGAELNQPGGIALDSAGNVYFADTGNYRIREVSNGIVSTVAGNGIESFSGDNGPAASAQLFYPYGIALDPAGSLYIADQWNSRIREVTNGTIFTVAGDGASGFGGDNGPAVSAGLYNPQGVAADSAGNLYIADTLDLCVRKVSNGVITTVAGRGSPAGGNGDGGPATNATVGATDVAVDSAGNLYISDGTARIRKVSNGIITTVAGTGGIGSSGDGGPATSAELAYPYSIAVDAAGNLFIADAGNNRIRKVSNGIITTVAGNGTYGSSGDGGPATDAELAAPTGIALDAAGNLYIADLGRIRRVSNGIVATIAGTGTYGYSGEGLPSLSAQIAPYGLSVDSAGSIYFSEPVANRIRVLKPCGTACAAIPTPVVTAVVNAASFQPGIEAGSWVTILGSNLANTNPGRIWNAEDFASAALPTQLDGVSVSIDGIPAFVEYISPTQINVQAPSDNVVGAVNVVVTNNGAASAPALAQLQAAAPAFFMYPDTNNAVASRLPDYAAVGTSSAPAVPGETIVLWGTGFGPTSPAVAAGTVVSGTPATLALPVVTLGGMPVTVVSAILTAGSAGLYQITIQLPANVPTGAVAVQASVGGVSTPAGVTILVENP
jgi:uncharacterized protein (TIGR03437 family)